jgi:hypothetical protein
MTLHAESRIVRPYPGPPDPTLQKDAESILEKAGVKIRKRA